MRGEGGNTEQKIAKYNTKEPLNCTRGRLKPQNVAERVRVHNMPHVYSTCGCMCSLYHIKPQHMPAGVLPNASASAVNSEKEKWCTKAINLHKHVHMRRREWEGRSGQVPIALCISQLL